MTLYPLLLKLVDYRVSEGGNTDLSNYYTMSQTDERITEKILDNLDCVAQIKGILQDVDSLPQEDVEVGEMYLVGSETETPELYIYTEAGYLPLVQNESIDLSEYAKMSDIPIRIAKYTDRYRGVTITLPPNGPVSATGELSFAVGYWASASGDYAYSLGASCTAEG